MEKKNLFFSIKKWVNDYKNPLFAVFFLPVLTVTALFLLGWSRVYDFFKDSFGFWFGCEIAVALFILALASKDKGKKNETAMNSAALTMLTLVIVAFVVVPGPNSDKEKEVIQPIQRQSDTGVRIIKITAPVRESSEFVSIPDNTRFFLQSEGNLRVTALMANEKKRVFVIRANDTLYLKDALDVRKLSFSSEESYPQEVVLRLFKKI